MKNLPIYARNLKFLRQIRGETQGDISDLLGKTTKMSIGMIETGRNGLLLTDAMKLADHYGITDTEFLRSELWRISDKEIDVFREKWKKMAEDKLNISVPSY